MTILIKNYKFFYIETHKTFLYINNLFVERGKLDYTIPIKYFFI
jgi:hypothetical protein